MKRFGSVRFGGCLLHHFVFLLLCSSTVRITYTKYVYVNSFTR